MAGAADLSDPAVLREFHLRLARFRQQVSAALDGAPTRLSRAQDRLRHELAPHWAKELSRRQDVFAAARRRYLEAEADVRANGRRGSIDKGSALDERREMLRAQRRCEEAEEKVAACKTWSIRLDSDGKDLLAKVRDHDISLHDQCGAGLAELDRLCASIEDYLQRGGGA